MSVRKRGKRWEVRYRDGGLHRSRTFTRKADASRFDLEMTRRRELVGVAPIDAGRETLDEFVTQTWAPTHGVTLAPKTRKDYASLYDRHIAPELGGLALREIRA